MIRGVRRWKWIDLPVWVDIDLNFRCNLECCCDEGDRVMTVKLEIPNGYVHLECYFVVSYWSSEVVVLFNNVLGVLNHHLDFVQHALLILA